MTFKMPQEVRWWDKQLPINWLKLDFLEVDQFSIRGFSRYSNRAVLYNVESSKIKHMLNFNSNIPPTLVDYEAENV